MSRDRESGAEQHGSQAPWQQDRGDMTVREAGRQGGERARELVQEGSEREQRKGASED